MKPMRACQKGGARFDASALPILLVIAVAAVSAGVARPAVAADEPLVTVISSDDNSTVVEFELRGWDLDTLDIAGGQYVTVSVPGVSKLMEAGFPELPKIRKSIIIPAGATLSIVELERDEESHASLPVAPSRGQILRTQDPAGVSYTFDPFYEGAVEWPVETFEIGPEFVIRDLSGATIQFNPFRYSPDDSTLHVCTRLRVEVDTPGGQTPVLPSAVDEFIEIYEERFANYLVRAYSPVPEAGEMLIIAADIFADRAQLLANFRQNQGTTTHVRTVSDMGGNTEAHIRNEIEFHYNANGVAYVVLLGDETLLDPPVAPSGGFADPRYVLLDGSDEYPDAFISRMCANIAEDVGSQINRIIGYEQSASGGWSARAVGIASDQGSGAGDDGESDREHIDNIRRKLLDFGYVHVDSIYDPGATAGEVTAALQDGRGFVNYCGHGTPQSWATTGFSTLDIDQLPIGGPYPFIVSVACQVGNFAGGLDCFCEHWLKAGTPGAQRGAVGAYGSTINQSWAPPMAAQDEIVDLLVAGRMRTFGGLCFNGAMRMIEEYGVAGVEMFETWTLFGDCATRLKVSTCDSLMHDCTLTQYGDKCEFYVNPTCDCQRIDLVFGSGSSCMNADLDYEISDGSWVSGWKHWNYNAGLTRSFDPSIAGTGWFRIVSQSNGHPFDVSVQCIKTTRGGDASSGWSYPGYSIGALDRAADEFGDYAGASYTLAYGDSLDLSLVPGVLGSAGIDSFTVEFPFDSVRAGWESEVLFMLHACGVEADVPGGLVEVSVHAPTAPNPGPHQFAFESLYEYDYPAIEANLGEILPDPGVPFPVTVVVSGGSIELDGIWVVGAGDTTVSWATGVDERPPALRFEGNFPNPFNPVTTIVFETPADGVVDLAVYDVAGRRVATILSGSRPAGRHAVRWAGEDDRGNTLASGVYFCRLRAGGAVVSRKIVLLR